MSLFGWRDTPYDFDVEIGKVLARSGEKDRSRAACKAWARRLIRLHVPTWEPGQPLSFDEAQRVGAAFETQVAASSPALPERVRMYRRRA